MTAGGYTTVESVADIRKAHRDIDGRAAETVRTLLNDHASPETACVLWVAEWLTDEKPLEYAEGHGQVAEAVIQRETEKAWQVSQPGADAEPVWIPKSQAVAFRAAPGVTDIETRQTRLGRLTDA